MPTQRFDQWPDFLEITTNDEGEITDCSFVCVRKNSYPFVAGRVLALRALENIAKVVVRVGTKDLTLQEFEEQGTFSTKISSKLIAQSTYYNKRAELKRFEQQLRELAMDDPSRELIWSRVQRLRNMLGLAEEGEKLDAELEKNTTNFNKLTRSLQEAQTSGEPLKTIEPNKKELVGFWNLDEDAIAELTIYDLERTGIPKLTRAWEEMVSRWSKCKRQKEMKNVTSKPDVASEVNATDTNGEGLPTTVVSPDRREGD